MMVEDAERRPPEKRSDRTKAAILQAARERLAAHGYDRTTIRAVAADAGIDPSMVMRYFVHQGASSSMPRSTSTCDCRTSAEVPAR